MQIVVWLLVFLSVNIGCGIKPPKPDFCGLEPNENGQVVSAHCVPTDPSKPETDKPVDEMIGYTCFSPKDVGGIKTFIKQLLISLDRNVLSTQQKILSD